MELFKQVKQSINRLQGHWAIESSAMIQIKSEISRFHDNPKMFLEELLADPEPKDILRVDGGTAFIEVSGPLVDVQDCATAFYGCTSYEEIGSAIKEAEGMAAVSRIVLDIDSPGGMVSGCDNCAILIKNSSKRTEAHIGKMAASAAYWLASQCDTIIATSATASFGSIGVVIEGWVADRAMEEQGYDKVQITSTNAPNKRVDPLSDEGRRKIKADLDEIELVFLRRVADGRKKTLAYVAEHFGQGGMFLAEKSLSVGMIDKNNFSLKNITSLQNEAQASSEDSMPKSLKEFLEKNPDAQAEFDQEISAAKESSKEEVSIPAEVKNKAEEKNNDFAIQILTSEAYGKSIKELAGRVIKGDVDQDALKAAVAAVDSNKESKSSEDAAIETKEIGDTPAERVDGGERKITGEISDEDSHKSAVTRLKNY